MNTFSKKDSTPEMLSFLLSKKLLNYMEIDCKIKGNRYKR